MKHTIKYCIFDINESGYIRYLDTYRNEYTHKLTLACLWDSKEELIQDLKYNCEEIICKIEEILFIEEEENEEWH